MKKEYQIAIEQSLKKINSIIYNDSQSVIYHYTSPSGLKGILSSNALRFTKREYLNDSTEMNYFFEVLEIMPSEKAKEYDSGFIQHIKSKYIKDGCSDLKDYTEKEYYVCCFSNECDELSLWNYYTKSDSKAGYNIAIKGHELIRSLNHTKSDWNYHLGEVVYLLEKQIEILHCGLSPLNDYYKCVLKEHSEELISYLKIIDIAILEIMECLAPFFKHPAFKNEEECRIICTLNSSQLEGAKIEIRESGGIFIPYMEVEIDKDIFEAITISPYIKSKMKTNSLNELTNKYGYELWFFESGIPVEF